MEIPKKIVQPYELVSWEFDDVLEKWIEIRKKFTAIYKLIEVKGGNQK